MSFTLKQLHTFALKQSEEDWHRECRGNYKAAWSQLRADLRNVAADGLTGNIGSFDDRTTLLKLTL
jgi:hypothetical protein